MSVWDETAIDGAPAWQPVNITAQLIEGRASLRVDLNPRFRLRAEAVLESVQSVEGLNLTRRFPYRPQLRAEADAALQLNDAVRLSGGLEWLGERENVRGLLSGNPVSTLLEPYARLTAQASLALSEAVSIQLSGAASLGEYRRFSSDSAPYKMTQHALGIGFAGRF